MDDEEHRLNEPASTEPLYFKGVELCGSRISIDYEGGYAAEKTCRKVSCRWPCWHHVHDWDDEYQEYRPTCFAVFGKDLTQCSRQGCAYCALLDHHCNLHLDQDLRSDSVHEVCESYYCRVFMDPNAVLEHIEVGCRDSKCAKHESIYRELFEMATVPVRSPAFGGLDQTPSASSDLPSQHILPLNYAVGDLHEDPKSKPVMDIIRARISECVEHHLPCSDSGTYAVPGRILDLNEVDDRGVLILRETHGRCAPYVALSYCWGSTHPPKTERDNVLRNSNAIPLTDLPRAFQDAVHVGLGLGVPFLWIDSLCIIQDDDEDRNRELGKMAGIFQGASLVVISAWERDAYEGFLHPRSREYVWSKPTGIRSKSGDCQMLVSRRRIMNHGPDACEDTAISERAWTLQERLLARRCLIFLPDDCIWECRSGCACECRGWKGGPSPRQLPFNQSQGPEHLAQVANIYRLWRDVVDDYSRRYLSVASDRLPAISAIAQYASKISQDQYLAGLWKGDILNQLVWVPESRSSYDSRSSLRPPTSQRSYEGPSWSWMSCQSAVTFWPTPSREYEAELVEAHCAVNDLNPFGSVRSAFIRLKGLACFAHLELSQEASSPDKITTEGGLNYPLEEVFSRPCHRLVQEVKSPADPNLTNLELISGATKQASQPPCGGQVTLFWLNDFYCLTLVRSSTDPDAFERIGIVFLNERLDGAGPCIPSCARETRIKLV